MSKKYCVLTKPKNLVQEIIPDEDPIFPGVPITDRYSAEFLAECIEVDSKTTVEIGMFYDEETKKFREPDPEPIPEPTPPDLESLRTQKLQEVSTACEQTIYAGSDVLTSFGSQHFSFKDEDQINIKQAYDDCKAGAAGFPYHADGELCKIYPATDIILIAETLMQNKLYHTTYCNHLNFWINRSEDIDELSTITYGSTLPTDLKANMDEVLTSAAKVTETTSPS